MSKRGGSGPFAGRPPGGAFRAAAPGGMLRAMQAIEYERRRLGKTDLQVPVLGIGGAQLGRRDEQLGVDTVLAALEAGIDLIDTSASYIGGESERYIGIALQEWYRRGNRREDLIIESKAGSRQRPHDYSYDAIMASTELSLRALQTDYLDVMLVHDPAEIEPVLAPHAAHDALLDLKKQGVIRHLGLGCRPHAHHRTCIATGDFEVSLTFRDYNLIERSALAGVLEPAVAADVGVFNASIMLSGLLGGDDPIRVAASAAGVSPDRLEMTDELRRAKRMYDWCAARGLDLHVVNLHYCLRETRFASVLLGFSTPERVAQNIAAYRQDVDPAVWEELDRDFPDFA